MRGLLVASSRAGLLAVSVLASLYAAFAYVPFTYVNLMQAGIVAWVGTFARAHAVLHAAGIGLVAWSLWPDLVRRRRAAAGVFVGVQVVAAVGLLIRPVLPSLRNDAASLAWALALLVPPAWLAALDLARWGEVRWTPPRPDRSRLAFVAALGTAFVAWAASATLAVWRLSGEAVPAGGLGWALASSLAWHVVALLAVYAALELVMGWAGLWRQPVAAEALLCPVVAAGVGAGVLRSLALRPLAFPEPAAWLFAASLSALLVASLAGVAIDRAAEAGLAEDWGAALLLRPLVPRAAEHPLVGTLLLVVAGSVAATAAARLAPTDWNGLLQKLAFVSLWLAAFAGLVRVGAARPGRRTASPLVYLGWAVVALAAQRGIVLAAGSSTHGVGAGGVAVWLDRYAGFDPSFRLILDAQPRATSRADPGFYARLQRHTNIPRSVHVEPVEVRHVERIEPATGPRPNVFVFVIDSLRQDYVSAYASGVDFTPEIEAFARRSVVFDNAFTRYGATGLSEPSIWVGGMLLHQQYVTPFAPMNSLQRLVEATGYRSLVSMDSVLATVAQRTPSLSELDRGVLNRDLDLCHTLGELRTRLERDTDDRPLFVYTQPQDVHVSRITREGATVLDGGAYPGFYAPYASRVRRLDACFGEFVRFLDARGLFDDSVVVFTSDHGDSLGEDGRWGHAYTLFPEIVRIPLIVHLPPALAASLSWDAHAPAFLTDITPSLYSLLGQGPLRDDPLLGDPLFTDSPAERAARRRDAYLLASSYGPVYGLLGDDGKSLFISDAVAYRDYAYRLGGPGGSTAVSLDAAAVAQRHARIRQEVERIADWYGFAPR